MDEEEVWVKSLDYEDLEISNAGRIRRGSTKELVIPHLDDNGYLRINHKQVCGLDNRFGGLPIHRLVLETFVSFRPEEMVCRHLNGIKIDNRLENLKWGTASENRQDYFKHKKEELPRRMQEAAEKEIRKIRRELERKYEQEALLNKEPTDSEKEISLVVRILATKGYKLKDIGEDLRMSIQEVRRMMKISRDIMKKHNIIIGKDM